MTSKPLLRLRARSRHLTLWLTRWLTRWLTLWLSLAVVCATLTPHLTPALSSLMSPTLMRTAHAQTAPHSYKQADEQADEKTGEQGSERLAVLELRDEAGLAPFERALLIDSVRGAALDTPFEVMTRENITALLPPNVKLEDCVGDCEVEVGRSIGAHFIITGHLGRLSQERSLRLLLRLYHTESGGLRAQAEASAPSVGALQLKAREAAASLLSQLAPSARPVDARTLLWVKVSPANAKLTLDGFVLDPSRGRALKAAQRGEGGGRVWPISPGQHTLKVSAPGYLSERLSLNAREGQPVEALLTLKRRPSAQRCDGQRCLGDVWVYTQPPGAQVWVDGERTEHLTRPNSTSPKLGSVALRLPEGSHWVRATLGERSAERLVRVKAGEHDMSMRKRPLKLRRARASLALKTTPSGALVRLNGDVIGKTPLERRLKPGAYWLEVVAEGRQSREELLTLTEGQRWSERWSLKPNTASLITHVTYEGRSVEGASVWLGGRRLGVTNSKGALEAQGLLVGEQSLEVRHPLYLPHQSTLTLSAGRSLSERVALKGAWAELSLALSAEQAARLEALKAEGFSEQLPERFEVLWEGELLGALPLKGVRVKAGSGWLQVRPSHEALFEPHRERLSLKVGEKMSREVSFVAHKARLDLQSSPPNARVTLNGQEAGRTPYSARLDAGLHSVELEVEGYPPFTKRLLLSKRGYQERVNFKERTFVEVRCDPRRGEVLLNGAAQGRSPRVLDVTPGRHEVGCKLLGAEISAPVELSKGEQLTRELMITSTSLELARWRRRWTPRLAKGAVALGALSVLTSAVLWLGPLTSKAEERDRLARRWLEAERPEELSARYEAWAQAEHDVQRYTSWSQASLWGGLSLSAAGAGLWWWSAQEQVEE